MIVILKCMFSFTCTIHLKYADRVLTNKSRASVNIVFETLSIIIMGPCCAFEISQHVHLQTAVYRFIKLHYYYLIFFLFTRLHSLTIVCRGMCIVMLERINQILRVFVFIFLLVDKKITGQSSVQRVVVFAVILNVAGDQGGGMRRSRASV